LPDKKSETGAKEIRKVAAAIAVMVLSLQK